MKCQRQILQFNWQQFVRKEKITAITTSDITSRRRNAVLGHITRLDTTEPAHQALRAHVNLSLGRNPDPRWKRRRGRPCCRWIDQIRKDSNNTPPADLWRREIGRGHGASLRPKRQFCITNRHSLLAPVCGRPDKSNLTGIRFDSLYRIDLNQFTYTELNDRLFPAVLNTATLCM